MNTASPLALQTVRSAAAAGHIAAVIGAFVCAAFAPPAVVVGHAAEPQRITSTTVRVPPVAALQQASAALRNSPAAPAGAPLAAPRPAASGQTAVPQRSGAAGLELPPWQAGTPAAGELLKVLGATSAVRLTLTDTVHTTKGGVELALEPTGDDPSRPEWRVALLRGKTREEIGQFTLASGALHFHWLDAANRTSQGELRNCLLTVESAAGSETYALRRLVQIPSPKLDLKREMMSIPVAAEGLPDPRLLELQLTGHSGLGTAVPLSTTARLKEVLRIVLRGGDQKTPGIELHLTLVQNANRTNVQVRPVFVDLDGQLYPFTLPRLEQGRKALDEQVAMTRVQINTKQAAVSRLELELRALSVPIVGTLEEIQAIEARRQRVGIELSAVKSELSRLTAALPVLEGRVAAVPGLIEVANRLHDKASLSFRVCLRHEGRQIDIVAADAAP